jgi:hypothetical protein
MMLRKRLAHLRETRELTRTAGIEGSCLSGGETDSAGSGNMQDSSARLSLFVAANSSVPNWRNCDPSRTLQVFGIGTSGKPKPLLRVAIANRDVD